jgi:hypothetical protein
LLGDSEQSGGQTYYAREIFEQEQPVGHVIYPTLGPVNYIKTEKWRVSRVFYYLSFISVACLGTIIISPHTPVEVAVVSIWTSSVALSRYLLRAAYNGASVKKRT